MTNAMESKDFHTLIRLALGAAERRGHPSAARRWLVEQLCKHTTATAGGFALAGNGEPPEVAPVARLAKQQRSAIVYPVTRVVQDVVCSALPAGQAVSVLWLRQTKRRWSDREAVLLDLLHPEVVWLHQPTNGRDTALSPRQSQTLRLLLRGQSEKQIAGELKLSVHTVHVYVKAIYKAHHVSSRAELLAKWVKE